MNSAIFILILMVAVFISIFSITGAIFWLILWITAILSDIEELLKPTK